MKGYVTAISGVWLGVSPQKETPFVRLQCSMQGSADLYHTLYLTEKTKDRTFETLKKYGYEAKTISAIDEFSGDGGDAATALFKPLDKPIQLVVVNESYTNKDGEAKEVTKIESIVGMGFNAKLKDKDKHLFKKFDLMFEDKSKVPTVDEKEELPY